MKILLVCLGILMFMPCQRAPDKRHHAFDHLLERGITKGFPGFILWIKKGEAMPWCGAKGYARLEDQKLMQPDQLFQIASITKLFTAVSILQLVDAGKLDMNELVINILDPVLVGKIPYIEKLKSANYLIIPVVYMASTIMRSILVP